jgi:hypothetical protein
MPWAMSLLGMMCVNQLEGKVTISGTSLNMVSYDEYKPITNWTQWTVTYEPRLRENRNSSSNLLKISVR